MSLMKMISYQNVCERFEKYQKRNQNNSVSSYHRIVVSSFYRTMINLNRPQLSSKRHQQLADMIQSYR